MIVPGHRDAAAEWHDQHRFRRQSKGEAWEDGTAME